MNFAHIHLVVNHFPLFAALFGGGLLAYGLLRDQPSLKSAGLVFGVLTGLGGAAAVMTGERAEDIAESYEQTNETALHEHEDAAKTTRWALGALGLVSLLGLVVPADREPLKGRLEWTTWGLFILVLGMVAWTASLGGPIRHPELSSAVPIGSVGAQYILETHTDLT